jgi:hypothetical protein
MAAGLKQKLSPKKVGAKMSIRTVAAFFQRSSAQNK